MADNQPGADGPCKTKRKRPKDLKLMVLAGLVALLVVLVGVFTAAAEGESPAIKSLVSFAWGCVLVLFADILSDLPLRRSRSKYLPGAAFKELQKFIRDNPGQERASNLVEALGFKTVEDFLNGH